MALCFRRQFDATPLNRYPVGKARNFPAWAIDCIGKQTLFDQQLLVLREQARYSQSIVGQRAIAQRKLRLT